MSLTGFSHNLQWREFKEVRQPPANVSEDAEIAITFNPRYSFNSPANQDCRVTTVNTTITLNQSGSWVVKGQQSDRLLSHELGNYDITALGAREVHNRISEITVGCCSDIQAEAQRIQQEVQDQINLINFRYDRQTHHGENSIVQTRWDNSIRSAKQSSNGILDNLPS